MTGVALEPTTDYGEVFRRHADRLWRALLAYTHDPEIASDALAEAYAQGVRRGDDLDRPERWIWRAAFRLAAGEMKRRGTPADLPEGAYQMSEPAWELMDALRQLSPKRRAAMVLHYYGGYPTGEIGTILGCTAATARVHLSQGRRDLRRMLEDDDG